MLQKQPFLIVSLTGLRIWSLGGGLRRPSQHDQFQNQEVADAHTHTRHAHTHRQRHPRTQTHAHTDTDTNTHTRTCTCRRTGVCFRPQQGPRALNSRHSTLNPEPKLRSVLERRAQRRLRGVEVPSPSRNGEKRPFFMGSFKGFRVRSLRFRVVPMPVGMRFLRFLFQGYEGCLGSPSTGFL